MRKQEGMASIILVSILVVVMTLISLGFARIMSRTISNSANRQFSQAATYAAQSGINDVMDYLSKTSPANDATNCTDFLGSTGAFHNDANISGDGSAQLKCLTLDQTPQSLNYTVNSERSQVVRVKATAQINKLLVSWQAHDPRYNNNPPAGLHDVNNWDSSNYRPLLRLTIYPIPNDGSLTTAEKDARTVFLFPTGGGSTTPVAYSSLADGSLRNVNCASAPSGGSGGSFNVVGSFLDCNLIVNGLTNVTPPTPTGWFYLRLTSFYSSSDVKIEATDASNNQLSFKESQAVIDSTATVGGVTKRLQARVDISSLNGTGDDGNVSSGTDIIPEDTIRSANAICKRLTLNTSGYSYVQPEGPDVVCHDQVTAAGINLTLTITGQDFDPSTGTYVTATRDSEQETPVGSGAKGTIYVPAPPNIPTINWKVTDATSCTPSGDFTGSAPVTGQISSGSFTPASNLVTPKAYTLTCKRNGAAPVSKTVKAQTIPTATVTAKMSGGCIIATSSGSANCKNPGTAPAGTPFYVNWSSTGNNCTLTGNWSDTSATGANGPPAPAPGGQLITTDVVDNTAKTFTAVCKDAIGRPSAAASVTVNMTAPSCSPVINAHDNGNQTGYWNWSASCPQAGQIQNTTGALPPYVYTLYNCVNTGICGNVGASSGNRGLGVGDYSTSFKVTLAPWGQVGNISKSWTILPPPPVCSIYSYVWFQGQNKIQGNGNCAGTAVKEFWRYSGDTYDKIGTFCAPRWYSAWIEEDLPFSNPAPIVVVPTYTYSFLLKNPMAELQGQDAYGQNGAIVSTTNTTGPTFPPFVLGLGGDTC